ncbi:hypothetical protein F511_47469 [Dorcoceras hygrometricum]|uniref:Uncharacterized protein n=1 Tax=Dorcoceras hygrometricum TaxID=472368 RepID=A0A2Z6ZR03_9LAMI|nr:hypothetical protein F511_47469 [Dorcoceras hygrometricum]
MRIRREASCIVRNTIARWPRDGQPRSRAGHATAARLHARLSRMPGGRLAPLDASRNLAAAAGRRWAKLLDAMHAAGRRLAAGAPRLLAHDRRWSAQPVAHEERRWHADGRAGATRWCAAAAAFFCGGGAAVACRRSGESPEMS